MFKLFIVSFLMTIIGCSFSQAGDPDILSDFVAPINSTIDASFFTFTGMRQNLINLSPQNFTATKASQKEFPALSGQGISMDVLQFPPGSINPPHTRSRATGLLFVLEGTLEVGLIDTNNKLFTQTLQKGDMFVFPKGLVHYQYNTDAYKHVTAVAAFGSSDPGGVSIPSALFMSGISTTILAKAFRTDDTIIQKIEEGLGV